MGRIARRIAALPPHRWLRALAEARDELHAAVLAAAQRGAPGRRQPEADDDPAASGGSRGREPTAGSEPAAGSGPVVEEGREVPRRGHHREVPAPTPRESTALPGSEDFTPLRTTVGTTRPNETDRAEAAAGALRRFPGTTGDTQSLAGREFRRVATIRPEADANGLPVEETPHLRYDNREGLPLNRHGHGPFCRFSVWGLPPRPGVYAVTVAGGLVYVGIANDLRERWSSRGYARIHPRNCFRGGQSTNCKVNHAILTAARGGREIHLWIHETLSPRPVERRLIAVFEPPWNDRA